MFEFLKEVMGAMNQRIRSPFLGSIILVFIASNWKPLVYLFYADKTIRAKFLYFDANTSLLSLYIIPILLGVFFALISPWIKWIGAECAKLPSKKLNTLEEDEARLHRIYQFRQSASEERALGELEDARERRVLNASKRSEEARDTGKDAEEKLATSREKIQDTENQSDLNEIQKLVIETLGSNNDGLKLAEIVNNEIYFDKANKIISNINRKRLSVDTDAALAILMRKNLTTKTPAVYPVYSLTSIGYKLYDSLMGA